MDWKKWILLIILGAVKILLIATSPEEYLEIMEEQTDDHLLFVDNKMKSENYTKSILLFTPFLDSAVIKFIVLFNSRRNFHSERLVYHTKMLYLIGVKELV
jgi:hypothetical protein